MEFVLGLRAIVFFYDYLKVISMCKTYDGNSRL